MVTWNNLNTLASFQALSETERVDLVSAMTGENGAERVKNYSIPMAAGLVYNYAAKQVDEKVIDALVKLAEEAQLGEKFTALYNGEVINTGEKRLVLHHMTRGQLGEAVEADGVDKRAFYVEQQERIAEFANKVRMRQVRNLLQLFRLVSVVVTLVRVQCILHLKTGQRRMIHLRWKQSSSAMLTRMMRQQF